MTDETRTYDCGRLPVELTLPKEEFECHEQNGKDFYRNYLTNIVIIGSRECAKDLTMLESFADYISYNS